MSKDDKLFSLIQSLSKNEKGYFKKYSSMHIVGGKNNYIKIFDFLEKQKKYNEDELKKTFRNEKFIRHLSSEKDYLFHNILKSLTTYYSDHSADSKIKKMIDQIGILLSKSLYDSAKKILQKAKTYTETTENYILFLELLELEKSILFQEDNFDALQKHLKTLEKQRENAYAKLKNIEEYWSLHASSIILHRRFYKENITIVLKEVDKLLNHPLLLNEAFAITYPSKRLRLSTRSTCFFIKTDAENYYKCNQEIIQLMEKHPEQIKKDPDIYIKALNNLLISYSMLQRHDQSLSEITTKLRNFKFPSQVIESRVFLTSYNIELNIYADTGNFDMGIKILPTIIEGFKKHKRLLKKSQEVDFYFLFALMYFGVSDFSTSLTWLNKIINTPLVDFDQEAVDSSKILSLIVHYELRNDLLLYNIISSAEKTLQKKSRFNKTKRVMLKYLKKLVNNNQKTTQTFNLLKKELVGIFEDKDEMLASQYFNYLAWVDSKIHKKPFSEMIKQNLRSKKAF